MLATFEDWGDYSEVRFSASDTNPCPLYLLHRWVGRSTRSRTFPIRALTQYSFPELFLPGTSQADRPGKTCALPDIWEDTAKLEQAFKDFQTAVAALGDVASIGQPALAAAVGEMGKACGGCHKPFRDRDPATNKWCLPDS